MDTVWVGTDVRVAIKEGVYYSTHPALNDLTVTRCRQPDMRLVLVARETQEYPEKMKPLQGADEVVLLQEGTGGAFTRLARLARQIGSLRIKGRDIVVCRVPEVIGTNLWLRGTASRCTTIANLVAEGKAAVQFLGRDVKTLEPCFERVSKFIAKHSCATVYVTRRMLQQKYPPGNSVTLGMSNVALPDDWATPHSRKFESGQVRRLVAVGNMDSSAKGFDLLIRALGELKPRGGDLSLTIVGDGSTRSQLEELSASLGLDDAVSFTGFLSDRQSLREVFDASDMMVMPSRSEGLPRAAVEAQARGLVCLGSAVGGVPEVVPDAGLFPSGDIDAMGDLIWRCHSDGEFASDQASAGHRLAREILDSADPERFRRLIAAARHREDSACL